MSFEEQCALKTVNLTMTLANNKMYMTNS